MVEGFLGQHELRCRLLRGVAARADLLRLLYYLARQKLFRSLTFVKQMYTEEESGSELSEYPDCKRKVFSFSDMRLSFAGERGQSWPR
jgi:hypothetical protein